MKKKILIVFILALTLMTGCFKRDSMDGIKIYTTTYPIEYLIDKLYGYNSTIKSIYPLGVDPNTYELTNKQIKEYSKTNMFVYNGLTNEKQIAVSFLNKNKNIKIIDVTKGIVINNDEEELWLCPTNYLMIAQNIKNDLLAYSTTSVVKTEINERYDNLNLIISKYDAELTKIAKQADNKTLIVGNNVFKFLEQYGFKVLSVEEGDTFNQNEYNNAKNNITNKSNSFIFLLDADTEDKNTKALVSLGAKVIKVKALKNLSESDKKNNYNYTDMMNDFLEQIKKEVYN